MRRILRIKIGLKPTKSFEKVIASEGISLYIHLPFVKVCVLFVAVISELPKNHEVENPYIEASFERMDLIL
jgi:oxygen-independent coproporphyrinogen-3 oxidase